MTVCCEKCCNDCYQEGCCLEVCIHDLDDFDADELGLDPEEEYDA